MVECDLGFRAPSWNTGPAIQSHASTVCCTVLLLLSRDLSRHIEVRNTHSRFCCVPRHTRRRRRLLISPSAVHRCCVRSVGPVEAPSNKCRHRICMSAKEADASRWSQIADPPMLVRKTAETCVAPQRARPLAGALQMTLNESHPL